MAYKKRDNKGFTEFWKKNLKKIQKGKVIKEEDAPLLNQLRDLKILQALAISEYEDSLVVLDESKAGNNYSVPDTGYIHLSFKDTDRERFKKIVAMHEAAHLTITPVSDELDYNQRELLSQHKELINILEDVRVNRYLCLKYPGLTRYYDSELKEEQNPFVGLGIGDLVGQDIPTQGLSPAFLPFIVLKDEIRDCITFEDVLRVAQKIVDIFDLPPEQQQKSGNCNEDGSPNPNGGYAISCPNEDDSDEEGDQDSGGGSGDEDQEEDEDKKSDGGGSDKQEEEQEEKEQEKPQKMPGNLNRRDLDDMLRQISNNNEKSSRLFDSEQEQVHGWRGGPDGGTLTIVKKDKDLFMGDSDHYETFKISKHILKSMQKDFSGWRSTREGRLNKINLTQLYTDAKVFKRRNIKKVPPKAYIILDGSGSMYGESRSWQKSASTSLTKLFKEVGIEYRIFIHSGTHNEFYYSEILDKDIKDTSSYAYTLDGSMLQALFEYEIPKNQKGMIFYFSDGGIAAQYESIQVPLLEKYNMLAEKRGTPIFGIGINTADVDVFRHWYVMKNPKDLPIILNKIGGLVSKYLQ